MRHTPARRSLLLAALALPPALTLGACSSTSSGADEQAGAAGEDAATRSVDHARGTAEVPQSPQRVVVLEPVELDTAVALGTIPVGAAVASNVAGVPTYLGVDGVEPVGTVPEPDLEAIAALAPDLILGTDSRHSDLFAQLEAIAPTVFMQTQADPWQENVLLIGEALGAKDAAQELLDEFDQRCAEIGERFDVSGRTANMIRPRDETTLSLYGPTSFAGGALEAVGLTVPEQDWADGLQADLSPENILEARADYVFVTTVDVDDESTIPPAISDNRDAFPSVTLVDTSYWVSGVGPKGGALVLDDIEQFLDAQQ
ncbi:ABC transporter substrate-binding protein [Brachybacterium saurashtrense]|uniref:Iron-siderophore ABC transporter substrate-binding protein n=1 Tax=Brachybacterium saurashtrense TaxID=556288 RepID=A0A345YJT2_9MICO|nr:iron-siderophore ABC transporter substrate-binding protein [Brachybacterium saurashtrense]AXK44184.1 iron-siderophore ABC transporter substrate-binding protein [Brachybacterium saurashtrense]RRR21456.1 iron-siderophore ABC transporter substrate-binding protein [Brachybacterium saurashtrense]